MPAFTGPDDAALCVLVGTLLTAHFGAVEMWATELDLFGFGGIRTGHLMILALLASFGCNNIGVA